MLTEIVVTKVYLMKRKGQDKPKLQTRINSHCISSKHSAGNIFIDENTSALAGFHTGPLSWSNWNLERDVFQEGKNIEVSGKNSRSKARTNIKLSFHITPRHDQTKATFMVMQVLSLLHQHCYLP